MFLLDPGLKDSILENYRCWDLIDMTLAVEDCNFVCTCYVNVVAYNNDYGAFVDVNV